MDKMVEVLDLDHFLAMVEDLIVSLMVEDMIIKLLVTKAT